MTRKRFEKLARAYFTRLNEYGKENHYLPLNVGYIYKKIQQNEIVDYSKYTRQQWWDMICSGYNFGVGEKH